MAAWKQKQKQKQKQREVVVDNRTPAERFVDHGVIRGLEEMYRGLTDTDMETSVQRRRTLHTFLKDDVGDIWTVRSVRNGEKYHELTGETHGMYAAVGRSLEDREVLVQMVRERKVPTETYPVTLCAVVYAETLGPPDYLERLMNLHLLFDASLLFNGTFVSQITLDYWMEFSRARHGPSRGLCGGGADVEYLAEELVFRYNQKSRAQRVLRSWPYRKEIEWERMRERGVVPPPDIDFPVGGDGSARRMAMYSTPWYFPWLGETEASHPMGSGRPGLLCALRSGNVARCMILLRDLRVAGRRECIKALKPDRQFTRSVWRAVVPLSSELVFEAGRELMPGAYASVERLR